MGIMKNQLRAGVVLSYISTAITILIQLIYMPVMIRLLGKSEYGLYSLVSVVVSYLSLFSLGFSGAYIRFFSRVRDDRQETASLNGMFFTLFSVLATVATVCGVVLSFFPRQIFGSKLTEAELAKARILMLILIVSIAVSLINSLFESVLCAYEQFVFQRAVGLLASLLSPFLSLPLLLLGYRSIMLVTVTTVVTITRLAVNVWFCLRKIKIPVSFGGFSWGLLKEISVFSSFLFVNMIIDQINWNADKFILGHTSGTEEIAVYGVASQINGVFNTFSITISSVFAPRVNTIVAKKGSEYKADFTALMAKIGRIQWMVLGLLTLGFLAFGKYFILNIYAGAGYENAYAAALFLTLPALIPLIQNIGVEMQRALNKHQFRTVIYVIMTVCNVAITIPLAQRWGAVGAAAGTAISFFLGNGILINVFYHRVLKIDMKHFWREILKTCKGLWIPAVAVVCIRRFVPLTNHFVFAAAVCAFAVIYCASMLLLGCNDAEKRLLRGMFGGKNRAK